MIKNFKWLLLVSLAFVACDSDDDEVVVETPVSAGSADFSKYVAVGNSLTAGYSDGALFIEGQKGSYTNLLSQQFSLVGGGEFRIPFMDDNLGGFSVGGVQFTQTMPRLFLNDCTLPETVDGISATVLGASIASSGPYNNTGIPGARCIDLVTPGFAGSSPYFARIATSPAQTVLDYATSQSPTFFSLWIGNNDVLAHALAGGDPAVAPITPSAGAVGVGFDASYAAIVDGLTAGGAKGVIANIPYVTTIPHFTTIPVKPLEVNAMYPDAGQDDCTVDYPISPADVATINSINTLIGMLKQILTPLGADNRVQYYSTTDSNPLLITDESLPDLSAGILAVAQGSGNPQLIALAPFLSATYGKARHTTAGDLIPLGSRSAIASTVALPPALVDFSKRGITYPMEDRYILVPSEIVELKNATDAFNVTIKAEADSHGLAFVDANAILSQINSGGIVANNYTLTSAFVTGGVFSLDGVHPGPRGYAFIANKFLEAINAKYGSTFRMNNMADYRILYPDSLP